MFMEKNLEIGDILCIYLKDLYFFDIFPIQDGEEFNIEKFQPIYQISSIFNNSKLSGSQNISEEWVTLLRYDGNDRFIEYYTGMPIFALPTEVVSFNEVSDYFHLCNFLVGRPLFFDKENTISFDNVTKNKILLQQEKADNIFGVIDRARMYVVENFNLKTDNKKGELVRFDIPFAYEENAVYNFTRGLSLARKLQIREEENAE